MMLGRPVWMVLTSCGTLNGRMLSGVILLASMLIRVLDE